MTASRRWLANGLLLVVAGSGALAVTELGLRWFAPQPTGLSHQDRYGLALHWPNMTRHLPQYGTTATFNSVGMRDREHALAKPAGTYRILLLGDSFMEALQVDFPASLPSLLEQRLAQVGPKTVEVVNAGVSGWGTDDELRYLEQYGMRWKPDLVLVAMTLHNDISDNLRQEWHTMVADTLVEQTRAPMSRLRYAVVWLKAFLATRFQTYQLWRKVIHGGEMRQVARQLNTHVVDLFRDPAPDRIQKGWKLTELLLRRMRGVAAANGSELALVLLPLKPQLSDPAFAELAAHAAVPTGEMHREAPQEVMKGIGERLNIPVIDLLPAFRQWTAEGKAPLYLEWDGHWNAAGHALAASVVAEGLAARGVGR